MLKFWNKVWAIASKIVAIVFLVYAFLLSYTGHFDKATFFLVLSLGIMIMSELDRKVN